MNQSYKMLIACLLCALTLVSGCATTSEPSNRYYFSLAAPEHYDVMVEHLEFEKPGDRHWRWPAGYVSCCWKGPNGPMGSGGTMDPLPKYIGIQWFSFAEQKYYQRLIALPEDIADKMAKQAEYTTSKGTFKGPRDRLVIGLAPRGTIVLWIQNQIGNQIEVARMRANEIDGDPSDYRAATKRYLEENADYLKQHGVPTTGW
ncbi:DUF2931 family protein [Marinobacter halodurans]|uniref:DUF2931 family protein n=1 Tax=Marinobacter halodurans TaxID=2528979 RepID=A0ABY1ZDI3_9GAMM|nr:DUF2931 family protein [Marinobacter halodurans]TBW46436.1 DUF2931 family protein [Marinobacter halodurans]